jgi:hypothetical protein
MAHQAKIPGQCIQLPFQFEHQNNQTLKNGSHKLMFRLHTQFWKLSCIHTFIFSAYLMKLSSVISLCFLYIYYSVSQKWTNFLWLSLKLYLCTGVFRVTPCHAKSHDIKIAVRISSNFWHDTERHKKLSFCVNGLLCTHICKGTVFFK